MIKNIQVWFSQLMCHHYFQWRRSIHGMEIIARNGSRSEWKCAHCGKLEYRDGISAINR